MKIALATTIWKRPAVTETVLSYYSDLEVEGVDFRRIAVTSNSRDASLARDMGWDVTTHPNEPLSEKHNKVALWAGLEYDADAVCFFNSDDLISGAYFQRSSQILQHPENMGIRLINYVMLDLVERRGSFVGEALPGSGVILTREALDVLGWKPWEGEPINEFLDSRLMSNLREANVPMTGAMNSVDTPTQICALKSGLNIWSYEEHIRAVQTNEAVSENIEDVDPEEYLEERFPSVLDRLKGMSIL